MPYRIWQVVLLAVLTSAVGINYTLYNWFDYAFLGIVKGVMLKSLTIWGYVTLLLGIVMLASLALRKLINVKMIDTQIEYCMTMTFIFQLPLVSLWFMAIVMSGVEAIIGAMIHSLILILIGIIFLTSHLIPRKRRHNHAELVCKEQ